MKKLWMMFTFLSLAVAGYCANGQAGSEVNADAQQQTVYICVVTSSSGTEVIATRVNGDYNAQVAVASEVSFDYSSESHQDGSKARIILTERILKCSVLHKILNTFT